jgi:hypothetical protein
MLSWITKITLELMAYGAMFATQVRTTTTAERRDLRIDDGDGWVAGQWGPSYKFFLLFIFGF